jgi:hypothetical protein
MPWSKLAAAAFFAGATLSKAPSPQIPVPVTIIGGSAAAGWHDAAKLGYVVRALEAVSIQNHMVFSTTNPAIPGARVINPGITSQWGAASQ